MSDYTPTESELIQDLYTDEYGEQCSLWSDDRARAIAMIKADAWDEGHDAGYWEAKGEDYNGAFEDAANPHRGNK